MFWLCQNTVLCQEPFWIHFLLILHERDIH
jgi:hypothetical protein